MTVLMETRSSRVCGGSGTSWRTDTRSDTSSTSLSEAKSERGARPRNRDATLSMSDIGMTVLLKAECAPAGAVAMKLIIQIPCFNESKSLPIALADLPKEIPGIDRIELLVINDGSTDDTVEVARRNGVHHVVGFRTNQGLARAFMLGIHSCLQRGADIIVNTDADNQYVGADIPKLVQPTLAGRADLVIGARPISEIAHFSPIKKLLQKFGSWAVRRVSGTTVADAPSGFRAISRETALALNVFSGYTYTLETIIQAGQKNMSVVSVPIRVNGELRPSRLVRSIPSYVQRSIL